MQFHKEINEKYNQILEQLEKEREEKKKTELQIIELKNAFDEYKRSSERLLLTFKEKINTLEEKLNREVNTRKKLTFWIKENIGENLEHLQKFLSSKQEEQNISKTSIKPRSRNGSQSISTNQQVEKNSNLFAPYVFYSKFLEYYIILIIIFIEFVQESLSKAMKYCKS